jgi:hypothetical protein
MRLKTKTCKIKEKSRNGQAFRDFSLSELVSDVDDGAEVDGFWEF